MPIEGYFQHEDGSRTNIGKIEAGETFFFHDYEYGSLKRIIGIQCPIIDLYGVIHVIKDKQELDTACPENLSEKFTKATIVAGLAPDSKEKIEVEDRDGKCSTFIMQHTVPFTRSMN